MRVCVLRVVVTSVGESPHVAHHHPFTLALLPSLPLFFFDSALCQAARDDDMFADDADDDSSESLEADLPSLRLRIVAYLHQDETVRHAVCLRAALFRRSLNGLPSPLSSHTHIHAHYISFQSLR